MNKPKYLVINTKGSKSLSDAVVALIRSATNREMTPDYSGRSGDEYPFIYFETGSGCFTKEAEGSIWNSPSMNAVKIDAATEIGKLALLIEVNSTIIIKGLALEGGRAYRDGEISEDKKTLTVGCSTVTREKVEEAYKAMFSYTAERNKATVIASNLRTLMGE